MKKQLIKTLIMLTILLAFTWSINIQAGKSYSILVVPDDYPTIFSAVNHAAQGDTILVKQGVYYENIQINKTLTLQGQDSKNTFIIGKGGADRPAVLTLAAFGIKVSGFTIESANGSNPSQNALGINIQGDNATITGNVLRNNYFGIFCALQSGATITGNLITSSLKDGIRFYSGSQNKISGNNISANAVSGIALGGYSNVVEGNYLEKNTRGIGLGASNSVVFNNTIVSNTESGVFLSGSENVICSNEIDANKYGVYITTQGAAPRNNEIFQNNLVGNFYNAFGNSSFLVELWDTGVSGNYWSDCQSTLYIINSNNTDNHPLATPFDTSNADSLPAPISPKPVFSSGAVALWTFDNIAADGVVADSTGNNPAVLASSVGSRSYIPVQVQGKFGQALSFDGSEYAFVPPSNSLMTPKEVMIDAWVNVQQIKAGVAYNNILVECLRTTLPLPTRTLGLAINGETPQNDTSPIIGALRGYVMTQNGVLNEIDSQKALPLNQWVHVVFARSAVTGMHLYVNGEEQAVTVFSGLANPTGSIELANELYIGHDSITEIDQLQISNMVESQVQPLWLQWWLWAAVLLVFLMSSLNVYFKRRDR
jgi:parallel beta-helix repeat protein